MISHDEAQARVLAKRGRPKKEEEKACTTRFKFGTKEHWIARLKRDGFADLAARVEGGKLSANAAALQVGYRTKSPLAILRRAWKMASAADRAAFLAEIER